MTHKYVNILFIWLIKITQLDLEHVNSEAKFLSTSFLQWLIIVQTEWSYSCWSIMVLDGMEGITRKKFSDFRVKKRECFAKSVLLQLLKVWSYMC